MTLRHIKAAILTTDAGKEIPVEFLGKGMFHTCYVDRQNKQVYSITINRDGIEDYSKEIVTFCETNPHLPAIERFDDMGDSRVYKMPLYYPIQAKQNPVAWSLLKQLIAAGEKAWLKSCKVNRDTIGYEVNQAVLDEIDADASFPQDLRDALRSLAERAMDYGQGYMFEFSKRNVMVDENSTLILLDVLFDTEAARKIRAKKGNRY